MNERDITRGGILIGESNATEAIRKAAEENSKDKYREFRKVWHHRLDVIKARFFDGVYKLEDQSRLPPPPVAIEEDNYRHLASYQIVPDGYGLNDKLTLNAVHLTDDNGKWTWDYGGEQGLLECITHEVAHEYIQRKGKDPYDPEKRNATHSPEFIEKLEQLGIHCDKHGVHTRPCDDPNSPVGVLMREWGIPFQPVEAPKKGDWYRPEKEKGRGRSTINKESCPSCGEIRYSTKKHPKVIICGECLVPYVPATAPAMLGMTEEAGISRVKGESISPPHADQRANSSEPTDRVLKPGEEATIVLDEEIKRRQMEEWGIDPKEGDDPEDLTDYLQPYMDYGDM